MSLISVHRFLTCFANNEIKINKRFVTSMAKVTTMHVAA